MTSDLGQPSSRVRSWNIAVLELCVCLFVRHSVNGSPSYLNSRVGLQVSLHTQTRWTSLRATFHFTLNTADCTLRKVVECVPLLDIDARHCSKYVTSSLIILTRVLSMTCKTRSHIEMVLPLRMFRLQNHWTNSEEIWYERYATGAHTRNSNSSSINNTSHMADKQICKC